MPEGLGDGAAAEFAIEGEASAAFAEATAAEGFDGRQLRDLVVAKWGKEYDVEFTLTDYLGKTSVYLNVFPWSSDATPWRHDDETAYLEHLQAIAEQLVSWGRVASVKQQIAETGKVPRRGTIPLKTVPIRLDLPNSLARRIDASRGRSGPIAMSVGTTKTTSSHVDEGLEQHRRDGHLRLMPRQLPSVRRSSCAMLLRAEAILFDADGTLLDSLPPHVQFCNTLNSELDYGLSLPEPRDVDACRLITAAPMAAFFRRAGFPEREIERCVRLYEARFASECPVTPFRGVEALLAACSAAGARCGIVSSNTASNVRQGLGEQLCEKFDFIDGIDTSPPDKADAITAALARLGVPPSAVTYVGDTHKDWRKATEAGVAFIGVDWGFEALAARRDRGELQGAPVATSMSELEALLLEGM